MQTQPGSSSPKNGDSRRARQAALISDDTYKGGARINLRRGAMPRRPWHSGPGHLWEGGRKHENDPPPE